MPSMAHFAVTFKKYSFCFINLPIAAAGSASRNVLTEVLKLKSGKINIRVLYSLIVCQSFIKREFKSSIISFCFD